MKKVIIKSTRLRDTEKWYPSGFSRQAVAQKDFDDKEISFPKQHFNTKEEADNYLKAYFIAAGYKENEIEIR